MNRGDIFLADLGEPIGHEQARTRPVVIISAQPWLEANPPVVTVLPLTRTRRRYVTHIEIEPGASGLQATSYAKCEDIRSISPKRLGHRYGRVDDLEMTQIQQIVVRLLGF